jgi:PAS domain S-box-containing protein
MDGGGSFAARMRSHDWAQTSLGSPLGWSPALRTNVQLMMKADLPTYIIWGVDGACLYNEAYRRARGFSMPTNLFGRPIADAFRIDTALIAYGGNLRERHSVVQMKAGRRKLVTWGYAFNPIEETVGSGRVDGYLIVCTDERKTISAPVRRSSEAARLHRLLKCSPGFIAIMRGPNHIFEFANDMCMKLFGLEDCIGKTVREAWPFLDGQELFEALDRVFTSGESVMREAMPVTVRRSATGVGEARFLNFVYEPMKTDKGQITGVFCEGMDVTARVLAEQALRASESALRDSNANLEREILERTGVGGRYWEVSPDLIAVISPEGHYEKSNPAWERVLGWSNAELREDHYLKIVHPDDQHASELVFQRLEQGIATMRFENRLRARDGRYRWFAWSAVQLKDRYYCCGRDITTEKMMEAELARSSSERDRVWKNSRDILTISSPDGIMRAVSPAWTEIIGHDTAEVVGRHFSEYVVPEEVHSTQSALDFAASNHRLHEFVNRYRHKDGTLRWISWHSSTEGGMVYGFGRDVTASKSVEDALHAAQDTLRQSQKMDAVGQLTGGLAHDFNNLLGGVSGSLELLEENLTGDQSADSRLYLNAARDAVNRASALTKRLLAFAQPQLPVAKPVSLNRLVAGMEEMVRRTVGPGVRLETVLSADLWNVRVDAHQFESALLNLCINARDAMHDGGSLMIETGNRWFDEQTATARRITPGQYVSVSVSDTGAGMSPGVIEHAFEPFFTTKPSGMGSGLGLSIIYGFVGQAGGHARIYSEVDKGSMVSLYFPRFFAEEESMPVAELPGPVATGKGEIVLVVDDEATIRTVVTEVLQKNGYKPIEASDARAGLQILQSRTRVDLLVADVGLPGGINGRQMVDVARRLRPSLKVLFITGYAENAVLSHGHLERGMQVLTKPFPTAELATRVRELLRRPLS